ncbi:MAG: glycosyltransferase family 39 protein [Gammaproteobacteria bacterium]
MKSMLRHSSAWFLIGLIAVTIQIGLRPLLAVDETRYLSVAWEMWSRQDFLVPFLNAEPYSHKPPLLFWMIQGIWQLTGVEAWSARLVVPLLALLVIFQSKILARQLWPLRTIEVDVIVPWLLLGGWFWMVFMSMVQFDLLLTSMAMLAWSGLLRAPRHGFSGWLLVAAGIGLGVLAKGPVILLAVMPPAILAPLWLVKTESIRWTSWYLRLFLSLLAGAGLALAWAIPAGLAGGDAYREAIFWGQTSGRVVDSFAHASPWWSYLLWLPLLCLPWLLLPRLWLAFTALPAIFHERGSRFLLVVLISMIVAFSLVSGKQPKYLLPLLPVIMLLFARLLMENSYLDDAHIQSLGKVTIFSLLLISLFHIVAVPLQGAKHDLTPVSEKIALLQQQEVAVANLGKYHGEFHFLGRLIQPLSEIPYNAEAIRSWLLEHPKGMIVMYDRHSAMQVPDTVYRQPYRQGQLIILPVQWLMSDPDHLEALLTKA